MGRHNTRTDRTECGIRFAGSGVRLTYGLGLSPTWISLRPNGPHGGDVPRRRTGRWDPSRGGRKRDERGESTYNVEIRTPMRERKPFSRSISVYPRHVLYPLPLLPLSLFPFRASSRGAKTRGRQSMHITTVLCY